MNKLIKLLCELIEKLDRQYVTQQDEDINASLFVVSNSGDAPFQFTGENRKSVERWVHNASDQNMFLGPDDEINENRYSLGIAPGDTIIINSHSFAHLYKKKIYGFWDGAASASAKAMITEYYKS